MNTSGRLLLAFATKQPPMSSTLHGGGKRRPVTNLFDLPDSSERCRSVPFPGLDLVLDHRFAVARPPRIAPRVRLRRAGVAETVVSPATQLRARELFP